MSYSERADPNCENCKGVGFTIKRPRHPPFWEFMTPCHCLKPLDLSPRAQVLVAIRYLRSRQRWTW